MSISIMYVYDFKKMGSILLSYRKESGFTQAKLAALTGVSRDIISKIERGQFTGSIVIFQRYAQYAGFNLALEKKKHEFPILEELEERYGSDD